MRAYIHVWSILHISNCTPLPNLGPPCPIVVRLGPCVAVRDIDSLPISVETWRMTARVPKEHDRVTVEGHAGVLTVVDFHEQAQTADLRYVTGDGPVVEGVAWSALRYMDEGEA